MLDTPNRTQSRATPADAEVEEQILKGHEAHAAITEQAVAAAEQAKDVAARKDLEVQQLKRQLATAETELQRYRTQTGQLLTSRGEKLPNWKQRLDRVVADLEKLTAVVLIVGAGLLAGSLLMHEARTVEGAAAHSTEQVASLTEADVTVRVKEAEARLQANFPPSSTA